MLLCYWAFDSGRTFKKRESESSLLDQYGYAYKEFDSGLVALNVLTQNSNTTIFRNIHKKLLYTGEIVLWYVNEI